jgi:hypothetical protein
LQAHGTVQNERAAKEKGGEYAKKYQSGHVITRSR